MLNTETLARDLAEESHRRCHSSGASRFYLAFEPSSPVHPGRDGVVFWVGMADELPDGAEWVMQEAIPVGFLTIEQITARIHPMLRRIPILAW